MTKYTLPLRHYIFTNDIQQYKFIHQTSLAIIALTSTALAKDLNIWRRIDKGRYNIILTLPKAIFGPQSWFWQKII